MIELWASIADFPEYRVSNLGKICSAITGTRTYPGRPLKFEYDKDGYARVCLFRRNMMPQKAKRYVHILVARAFVPNPKGLAQVNHKDGVKTNCAADNLEWRSDLGNKNHAVKTGVNGAKGVYFHKGRGVWRAYCGGNKNRKHLGSFATEQEALMARKSAIAEMPNVV